MGGRQKTTIFMGLEERPKGEEQKGKGRSYKGKGKR